MDGGIYDSKYRGDCAKLAEATGGVLCHAPQRGRMVRASSRGQREAMRLRRPMQRSIYPHTMSGGTSLSVRL